MDTETLIGAIGDFQMRMRAMSTSGGGTNDSPSAPAPWRPLPVPPRAVQDSPQDELRRPSTVLASSKLTVGAEEQHNQSYQPSPSRGKIAEAAPIDRSLPSSVPDGADGLVRMMAEIKRQLAREPNSGDEVSAGAPSPARASRSYDSRASARDMSRSMDAYSASTSGSHHSLSDASLHRGGAVASLREAKAQERELDFEASLQSLRSRIAVRAPRDASFSMHSTSSSYGNHGPLSTGFSSTAGASASSIGPGAPAASPALMAARAPIPASRQLSGSRFAPDGNSSTVGRSGIPGVPLERGGSGPQGSSASHALGGATQTPPQTMPRASSLTVDSPGKGISSISGAMAGADAEPLPPGWEQKLDTPSGRVFYVNHRIRAISWERPGGSVVSERAAEPAKTAPAPAPAHDRASSLFGEAWRSGATLSGRFNSLASQGPVDGRGSAPSQRTPASAVEKAGEQTDSSIQLRSAGAARLQDVIDSPGSAIVSSAAPRPVSASLQVSTGERGQTDVTGITYSSASGLALPSSAVAGISPSKLSETEFMKKAAALLERRARGEGLGEGLGLGSTLDGGSLAIDHTHATKTSSWRSSASLYVPGGMRRSLDPARLSALARDVDSDVNAHSALRLGRRVEDEQTLDLLMKVSTVLQRGVKPREDPTGHGDWMDSGVDRRTSQFEFDIWARTVLPASPCPVLPALPAARDDTVCGLQPQILSQVPVDEDFLDENLLGGAQGYIRNRISSSFRRAEPVVQAQAKAPDPDLYAQTTWQI